MSFPYCVIRKTMGTWNADGSHVTTLVRRFFSLAEALTFCVAAEICDSYNGSYQFHVEDEDGEEISQYPDECSPEKYAVIEYLRKHFATKLAEDAYRRAMSEQFSRAKRMMQKDA